MNIAKQIHFYPLPKDAEAIFNFYVDLLRCQLYSMKKATSCCENIGELKKKKDREEFYAFANEYRQLSHQMKKRIKELLEEIE